MAIYVGGNLNSIDYFETPSLIGLRQQVKHLSQFGADALVVEGPRGSGRTRFSEHLYQNIQADSERDLPVLLAYLGLGHPVALSELLANISDALNLNTDEQSAGALLTQLRSYSQSLMREKKLSLLFLDGADYLEDDALGALISLVQAEGERAFGFKLLFFADFGFAERIDELNLMELAVYDFQMPPFSTEEMRRFLESKVSDFDERCGREFPSLAAIWNQSHGYPGQALDIVTGANENVANGTNVSDWVRFPALHIGVAVVLLAALLFSFFYGSDEEESNDRNTVKIELPREATKEDAVGTATEKRIAVSEELADDPPVELDQDSDSNEHTLGEESEVVRARLNSVVSDDQPVDSGPITIENTEPEKGTSDFSGAAPLEERPEPDLAASPPSRLSESADSMLTKEELFLLAADDSSYVLQLLAASKKPALESFVSTQENSSMVRIYRRPRSSEGPWYIVVIGPYSSKADAMVARENLPAKQKKAGPWPKSLLSVKSEIEAFRNN